MRAREPGRASLVVCACAALWACDDDGAQGHASEGAQLVAEAEALMPDYLAFHARVVARTCGPDGGVCHNAKEYPDLHTAANMLDAVGKDCNRAEDEPADVADMCEPQGDLLVITSGVKAGLEARIARHEVDGTDWVVTLDQSVTGCAPHQAAFRITYGDGSGEVVIDVPDPALTVACGSPVVRVPGFTTIDPAFQQALTRRVRMGDPNGNGVFGYGLGGALVVAGDPERSYLLQRVLGTVPGSPMPLANQPLDDRELLAFWCWIETVPAAGARVDDAIDYAGCRKAREVLEADELLLPTPIWLRGAQ